MKTTKAKEMNLLNLLNETLEEQEEQKENEEERENGENGEREEWEKDYKTLYEQQKSEIDKRKNRYKSSKANEQNSIKNSVKREDIDKMISDSLWAVKFYETNKIASEHKEEIEAFVGKWLDRDQAYKLVMADKDPTVLLDEAKKTQLLGNTWLQGVPANLTKKTNYTDEEILSMSSEEFEKINHTWETKKYYTDNQ